jgi:hypothetical protein
MTTTDNDREPLVYGPHRELIDLIETPEAALDKPRKRSAAIEAAIAYLCGFYRRLDAECQSMNDATRQRPD